MKKIILAALVLLTFQFLPAQSQRVILSETSKKVDSLENTVSDLRAAYQALLFQMEAAQQANTKTVVTDDSTTVTTTQPIIKAPSTVDEANALLLVLLGFVQFILTGFVPKEKLPRWLSPFMLSVIVAVVVTVVGLTLGNLSIPDGIAFFAGVSGIGNIIHQIKKPKGKELPMPAPTYP